MSDFLRQLGSHRRGRARRKQIGIKGAGFVIAGLVLSWPKTRSS